MEDEKVVERTEVRESVEVAVSEAQDEPEADEPSQDGEEQKDTDEA